MKQTIRNLIFGQQIEFTKMKTMLLKHFSQAFSINHWQFCYWFQWEQKQAIYHGSMFLESNRKSKNTFKNYDVGFWVSGDDLLVIMRLFWYCFLTSIRQILLSLYFTANISSTWKCFNQFHWKSIRKKIMTKTRVTALAAGY